MQKLGLPFFRNDVMINVYCENPLMISEKFCKELQMTMSSCRIWPKLEHDPNWVKVFVAKRSKKNNFVNKREVEISESSELAICFHKQ